MRCSGGSKCNCTLFKGGRRTKRCKSCHHGQGSHYEPSRNESGDDNDGNDSDGTSGVSDSNDSNDDDDDIDDGDGDKGDKLPLTRTRNKMTVSSLVADLINGGEHSRAEVESAKSEAKAGLTRRQSRPKQRTIQEMTAKPKVMDTLPPVVSLAKVLKIIVFPHGKETLKAERPVKLPPLTDTAALEEQGLVAHASEGLSFCKNWDSETMCLFFEQHLPRLFQYFKERGFNGKKPSKLPFCVLKREDRAYKTIKLPENGPTGRFYQDNATGPAGSSYKNRKIVLITKTPIPQDILDEWEHRPVSTENGPGKRGAVVKMRPKLKKVQVEPEDNPPLDDSPVPKSRRGARNRKRARLDYESESDGGETLPKPVELPRGKGKERGAERKSVQQGLIIISDNEDSISSQTAGVDTETERESPPPNTTKRRRVHSPGHADEIKSVELAASVSSLCLEEAPPSVGPSTTTSTLILGSWSKMRKSSAAYVVGDDVTEAMFDF